MIAAALVATLLLGFSIRLPGIKITSLSRVLIVCSVAAAIILAASRDTRGAARRWLLSPGGVFGMITGFAIVMSFGPDIHALGRSVTSTSLYALFYDHVPGFDGVRVPARYATIVTLGLAALTALGIARIDRRRRRPVAAVAGALMLVEACAVPMPINRTATDYTQPGLTPLPPSIATGAAAPAVYRYVAELPASAVVIELPLGEPAFDIRYMFYSTRHWKRLVNGYSGGAPADYGLLSESLRDLFNRPDRAWRAIVDSTATHAIVHEAAYTGEGAVRIEDWLRSNGAREAARFETDRVFLIPNP